MLRSQTKASREEYSMEYTSIIEGIDVNVMQSFYEWGPNFDPKN